MGDIRVGPDEPLRFLPSRFSVDGKALDPRGTPCHRLACPNCHLSIPRVFLDVPGFFVSVLGTPACGKSYFLASMVWKLRQTLPNCFQIAFNDADPYMNQKLTKYEEQQFLSTDRDDLTMLAKTELQGDLYNQVRIGDQFITYPQPYVFLLRPHSSHPLGGSAVKSAKALCVYDNAGESFLPGADSADKPFTRHLAQSRALFFLFDPTQDLRFRQVCAGKTNDPQMDIRRNRLPRESSERQDSVLLEAIRRIRDLTGASQRAKHARPLIIVVTKYDTWSMLMDNDELPPPWTMSQRQGIAWLDLNAVERRSSKLRAVLRELAPEVVSAAEDFAEKVIYVPVSASGKNAEYDSERKIMGIRPSEIQPQWAEVPLLYTLCRWSGGLIPYRRSNHTAD